MLKIAAIAALLLSSACTDIGQLAEDATGVDWEWTWQLRVVCPDQSRVVLDEGEACLDDVDAFSAERRAEPIADEGWCGEPPLRYELALDPVTFGPC